MSQIKVEGLRSKINRRGGTESSTVFTQEWWKENEVMAFGRKLGTQDVAKLEQMKKMVSF